MGAPLAVQMYSQNNLCLKIMGLRDLLRLHLNNLETRSQYGLFLTVSCN